MKLNFDCMKTVILTLESNLKFGEIMTLDNLMEYPLVQSFAENEVAHCLSQLSSEEIIVCEMGTYISGSPYCSISDITPKGYKLCKALRDESILSKIKPCLGEFASYAELIISIIGLING